MHSLTARRGFAAVTLSALLCACGNDSTAPSGSGPNTSAACPGINLGPAPSRLTLPPGAPATMAILGNGLDTVRYQAEVAARGTIAYTTSWGVRRVQGNKVSIWDVSGNVPVLIDSLILNGATTTGDIAVSDDGRLLVVATERAPGIDLRLRPDQSAEAHAALGLFHRQHQPRRSYGRGRPRQRQAVRIPVDRSGWNDSRTTRHSRLERAGQSS